MAPRGGVGRGSSTRAGGQGVRRTWLLEAESGNVVWERSLSACSTKLSSPPAVFDGVRKFRSSRFRYIACPCSSRLRTDVRCAASSRGRIDGSVS